MRMSVEFEVLNNYRWLGVVVILHHRNDSAASSLKSMSPGFRGVARLGIHLFVLALYILR